jgi:CBS domain-containing protein
MTVEQAMEPLGQTISWSASVGEAAATLLAHPQPAFAVTSSSGLLMGVVGRQEIIHAAKTEDWGAPIAPFVRKEVPKIVVGASVDTTLTKLAVLPAVAIVDATGSLCGLLTRRRLAEVIMLAGLLKRFPSGQ